MRSADVYVGGVKAAVLEEVEQRGRYLVRYIEGYSGPPISLTMPVGGQTFEYAGFPPFFEGLLPEGAMLQGLLRSIKLDKDDLFGQLLAVGADLVGAVTVSGTGR